MISCARHPDAQAGWRCDACGAALCPACVSRQDRAGVSFDHCALCSGLARQLHVPRGERDPFGLSPLIRALAWPFSGPGFLVILASAVVLSGFQFFGVGFIGIAVTLAFLFQIVRHTAQGHDDLPGPEDFHGLWDDVVSPLFRVAIALFWVLVPAVIWINWHRDPNPIVPLFLIGLGVLLTPMSLLFSALRTPISIVANPVYLVGYALRLGVDYLLAVGFFAVVCAFGALFISFEHRALSEVPLHGLLTNGVEVLLALIAFRAIGLLVRARGGDLGYGVSNDYLVPVLPNAAPLGKFDPAKSPAEGAATPAVQRSFEPIELAPEPVKAPAASEDGNLALLRLIAREDHAGCFLILERSGPKIRANVLSAQAWLALGKKAVEASAGKAAAVAFKRCIDVAPEGPLAPAAWLLAAGVYEKLLADRPGSDRLRKELLKRFPDSPEALGVNKRAST